MGESETGFLRKSLIFTRRCGKKPGFLGVVSQSETGFLREYSSLALNLGKNPVSWVGANMETAPCPLVST
ncbi:hypothetical protein CP500_013340 [Tychonema bourrellyi FEM_GT703]|uniref:Uncharacterized protein n=1 Tax=Tychonema bourrellyi FEM_GT703 TaxID=2040638 RepID=A0A2G4EZJ4_9CYAN|nr:hypothetical protein CP500_013340 [Tychonema bourrellyi FEM_GT703]